MYTLRRAFERAAEGGGGMIPDGPYGDIVVEDGLMIAPPPLPALSRFWHERDDFLGSELSTSNVNAGGVNSFGAQTFGTSRNVGVVAQIVTAVNDAARVALAGQAGLCFGGGAYYTHFLGLVPTRSDGANNLIIRAGWHDASLTALADATDGVYLEYDFATYGDHNWRLCGANNNVRTKVDTGIELVAGTPFKALITVSATPEVTCSINGVSGANVVTTNIPITMGRACARALTTYKQLGAGALTCAWDYQEQWGEFTAGSGR